MDPDVRFRVLLLAGWAAALGVCASVISFGLMSLQAYMAGLYFLIFAFAFGIAALFRFVQAIGQARGTGDTRRPSHPWVRVISNAAAAGVCLMVFQVTGLLFRRALAEIDRETVPVSDALDDFYARHARYPDRLRDLIPQQLPGGLPPRFTDTVPPLSGPVTYFVTDDRTDCRLSFPTFGMATRSWDCKHKRWLSRD